MFLKQAPVISKMQRSQGFMLPLAIFLVVAIAALAVGLSRSVSTVPFVALQEVFSQRAFYAAESGANYGLSHLLLRPDLNRADGDSACTELASISIDYSIDGLEGCRAAISCSVQSGALNDASYYTIDSQGSCGTAPLDATRTVSVSAYIPGEP